MIPVEGKHRVVVAEHSLGYHNYLFSDRVLESYNIQEKKVSRYAIPLGKVKRARQIYSDQTYLVAILDDKIRAFSL